MSMNSPRGSSRRMASAPAQTTSDYAQKNQYDVDVNDPRGWSTFPGGYTHRATATQTRPPVTQQSQSQRRTSISDDVITINANRQQARRQVNTNPGMPSLEEKHTDDLIAVRPYRRGIVPSIRWILRQLRGNGLLSTGVAGVLLAGGLVVFNIAAPWYNSAVTIPRYGPTHGQIVQMSLDHSKTISTIMSWYHDGQIILEVSSAATQTIKVVPVTTLKIMGRAPKDVITIDLTIIPDADGNGNAAVKVTAEDWSRTNIISQPSEVGSATYQSDGKGGLSKV